MAKANDVFLGLVLDADGPYPIPAGTNTFTESSRWFRMRVLSAWKGAERETIIVRTGHGGGDCGYDFRIGEVYLVYAYATPGSDTLSTGLCTRTSPLPSASQDFAALGEPRVDRTGGKRWSWFRPWDWCPVHRGFKVTPGHAEILFNVPAELVVPFRKVAAERFPYPGLQIDRPPSNVDPAGFRGINDAFVCDLCRAKAKEWLCQHGMSCPEFGLDTTTTARAFRLSDAQYRALHPMKRLAFLFDDGKDLRLDTIEGRLSRRIPGRRDSTVALGLSDSELQRIYDRMIAVRVFDLKTPHPSYYVPDSLRTIGKSANVQLFVRSDTTVVQLTWDAAYTTEDRPRMVADWTRLYGLLSLIRSVVEARQEYQTLFGPEAPER